MIKKTIITTAAILLAGVMLFGRNTLGYIRTSLGYVHDSVQNSVPVGFEIDHARQMIQDLVPEVRKNMHVIAKEEVEVQRLEEQIANCRVEAGQGQGTDPAAEDRSGHGQGDAISMAAGTTRPRRSRPTWPTASSATRPPKPRWPASSRFATPA